MQTSYNEVMYWNARTRPNATFLLESEREYLTKHLKGCNNILDFGPGTGRAFSVYEDKRVTGYDISSQYVERVFTRAREHHVAYVHTIAPWIGPLRFAKNQFDAVVCSSVLLHQRPIIVEFIISELARVGEKVIVLTWAGGGDTSEHCFDHDYDKLLREYTVVDRVEYKDQIYFVYMG